MYKCVYFFTFLVTKGRNTHRGALLEAVLKSRAINITKMVKQMGIARGTYYNHINDPHLSYEILAKYGKTMGYNFSEDLPDMKQFVVEEGEAPYNIPKNLEEAIEQRDYWKEKYYQLLEQYHKEKIEAKQ